MSCGKCLSMLSKKMSFTLGNDIFKQVNSLNSLSDSHPNYFLRLHNRDKDSNNLNFLKKPKQLNICLSTKRLVS